MSVVDRIQLVQDDITTLNVEAIVNAANTSLLGGGGVDGAIHRAAGPELLEACRSLGECQTGAAKITSGYRLPARYIIHTVGPVWHGGDSNEEALLASCYRSSFDLAVENRIVSIAFPAISTGVYRFPIDRACKIALKETNSILADHDGIQRVIFCCFSQSDLEVYQNMVKSLLA